MKSRIALLCAAAFTSMVLWGCASQAPRTFDVAKNLEKSNQYKEAVVKYEEFIKANSPDSGNKEAMESLVPLALYRQGQCYEKLGDKEAAMGAYNRAVQQYPESYPGDWSRKAMEDLKDRTLTPPPVKEAPKTEAPAK